MRSNSAPDPVANSPIVFVFFDPWTLGTGRLIGMVRKILEHGFRLFDFEFKTLSEADAEEIYRTNHPIREENSWHIARLIYPMGRSLGLLFGLQDPDSCACQRMQRLKGKANPLLNKAGQLRYDFMAPNRCLSLMHSSDSLAQVRREAAVFFSLDRIERACAASRSLAEQADTRMLELEDASSELGIERIAEPGVGTLLARIRLRIVEALQKGRPCAESSSQVLSAYRTLWLPLSRELARMPVLIEARKYVETVEWEKPLLRDILCAPTNQARREPDMAEFYRPVYCEPAQLLRCLEVLGRPEVYPQWDSDRQLPQSLLYDRWERLLFKTHLFNFDDVLSTVGEAL